jgi:integrase
MFALFLSDKMDKNDIDQFLNECKRIRSKNSKTSYRCHLNTYFKAIGKKPEGYINVDPRRLSNGKRLDLYDKIQKDVLKFVDYIENRPSKSKSAMISAVKKFLTYHYIDLPTRFWEEVCVTGLPITEKQTPKAEDLKYILDGADIRTKCLFLLCAVSGARIREILSLEFNDVDVENRTIKIRDYKTKKQYGRTSFFTPESQLYLKRWYEIRNDYILTKMKKITKKDEEKRAEEINKKTKEALKSNLIFPFSYSTARLLWVNLLEKSGSPFNEKFEDKRLIFSKGRYKFNEHSLRRFFKTNLKYAGMSVEHINYMIGHEPEMETLYTDDNIFQEKVKKEYDKHCNSLSIFSDAGKIKHELTPQINRQSKLISHQRNMLEAMQLEINELKENNQRANDGWATEYDIVEKQKYQIKELEEKIELILDAMKKS